MFYYLFLWKFLAVVRTILVDELLQRGALKQPSVTRFILPKQKVICENLTVVMKVIKS